MNLMELVSYISVDKTGFDRGLTEAGNTAKGFAEKIDGIASKVGKALTAAFSIAAVKKLGDAIIGLANDTAAYGDKVDKQSQVLGMSRKAYQEWDYILSQNGASIDSMAVSMKTLNSNLLAAADGSEESANAFAQLGLFVNELVEMSPEQQFEEVVRALQKMPAGAQKTAMAIKMFGKNGMDLLPLLNQESTSIDELRKRAEELGIIMGDDAIDASVAYGDAMDDLKRAFSGIKYALGAQLLPALTQGVTKIADFAGKVSNAFKQNGLQGVFDMVMVSFKEFTQTLKDSDSPVLTVIGESLDKVIGAIEFIGQLFNDFDGTVATLQQSDNPVLQVLGGALTGIKDTFDLIVGLFTNFDGTVATLQNSDSPVLELLGAALVGIKSNFDNIVGLFTNFDGTVAKLQEADSPVLNLLGAALEAVKGAIEGIIGFFTGFSGNVSTLQQSDNPVLQVLGKALETIVEYGKSIIAFFTGGFSEAVATLQASDNPVLQVLGSYLEAIGGAIQAIIGAFNGDFAGAVAKLQESDNPVLSALGGALYGIQSVVETIVGLFTDFSGTVAILQGSDSPVLSLIGTALGGIQTAAEFIKTLFTEGLPAAITTLAGADTPILGSVIQAFKDIQTWAQNAVEALQNFFGVTNDFDFTSSSNTDYGGNGGGSFAKGLWEVPYDMTAKLHRGERILTASQARRQDSNGADLSGLENRIERAIRAGMEGTTVRSYINGRDVTREVSKDLTRQVKARRFAT